MRFNRIVGLAGLSLCVVVAAPTSSEALSITPADATCSQYIFPPAATNDEPFIEGPLCANADLDLLYKFEGAEEGPLADEYDGAFVLDPDSGKAGDYSGVTISFVGTTFIECPSCWLLVKAGNIDPNFYGFDLNALGWDGQEQLELANFWLGKGSISHVAFFGKTTGSVVPVPDPDTQPDPVPEPVSLALLGVGLFGAGVARRRARR
jgi:hypothetical protein